MSSYLERSALVLAKAGIEGSEDAGPAVPPPRSVNGPWRLCVAGSGGASPYVGGLS